jgi:hypothetical protein
VVAGALILTYFGAFWAYESITNWPQVSPLAVVLLSLPVVALTVFAILRFIGVARLPIATNGEQAVRDGKRIGITFGVIFTVEFILIAVVSIILANLDRPLLIPVAIALIVGLHLFPLARVFRLRVYTITGLMCVVSSLASLLIYEEALRLLVLGLAVAIILWVSAGVVLIWNTGSNRGDSSRI